MQPITPPPFDSLDYWERRLRGSFDLQGAGFQRLGRRYNHWMYRVRSEVFDRVVEQHLPRCPGRPVPFRVLDIGSGTGFYVDRWRRRGADVTGLDVTEVAVQRLAASHPQARFVRADIGRPLEGELKGVEGTFDAVSVFDVLFHIVDDGDYLRALTNICLLLRPGGLLLGSDNLVHGPTVRSPHHVSRSLVEVTDALKAAGLSMVDRVPMFVLMNEPVDTRSRWLPAAWRAMVSPAVVSDRLGGVLGAMLYPIERRLVQHVRESPTTEVFVCRRSVPTGS